MALPADHAAVRRPLAGDELQDLSETLRALGSASRLALLFELLPGERTVEQLAVAVGLEQSATSHQLRLLRDQRLVRRRRSGRHSFYALHDHHVSDLLAAVRHHREHVHPPAGESLAPDLEAVDARA